MFDMPVPSIGWTLTELTGAVDLSWIVLFFGGLVKKANFRQKQLTTFRRHQLCRRVDIISLSLGTTWHLMLMSAQSIRLRVEMSVYYIIEKCFDWTQFFSFFFNCRNVVFLREAAHLTETTTAEVEYIYVQYVYTTDGPVKLSPF